MSTTVIPTNQNAKTAAKQTDRTGAERRRRRRAKIEGQVHIRAASFPDFFQEVCTTVDVSRDGLLFLAALPGYSKGQKIEVTFPYSAAPGAINQAQPAEVVRVTQKYDGKIAVAVQFAAARAERKAGEPAVPAHVMPPDAPRQPLVLAIEADAHSAESMREALSKDGYTMVVMRTAKEALEFMKTTVPDVFVAEVESEEMSGHDLCALVKGTERLKNVPLILLTRSAQPADYSASRELGAVVYMAKPFQAERFAHVVRLVAPPAARMSYQPRRFA